MYTHLGNSDVYVCVCRCFSGVRISQVCRLEDEEVTRMPPVRWGGKIGQTMFDKCRLQTADGHGQFSMRAAQARRSLLLVPRADLQLAASGFPGLHAVLSGLRNDRAGRAPARTINPERKLIRVVCLEKLVRSGLMP